MGFYTVPGYQGSVKVHERWRGWWQDGNVIYSGASDTVGPVDYEDPAGRWDSIKAWQSWPDSLGNGFVKMEYRYWLTSPWYSYLPYAPINAASLERTLFHLSRFPTIKYWGITRETPASTWPSYSPVLESELADDPFPDPVTHPDALFRFYQHSQSVTDVLLSAATNNWRTDWPDHGGARASTSYYIAGASRTQPDYPGTKEAQRFCDAVVAATPQPVAGQEIVVMFSIDGSGSNYFSFGNPTGEGWATVNMLLDALAAAFPTAPKRYYFARCSDYPTNLYNTGLDTSVWPYPSFPDWDGHPAMLGVMPADPALKPPGWPRYMFDWGGGIDQIPARYLGSLGGFPTSTALESIRTQYNMLNTGGAGDGPETLLEGIRLLYGLRVREFGSAAAAFGSANTAVCHVVAHSDGSFKIPTDGFYTAGYTPTRMNQRTDGLGPMAGNSRFAQEHSSLLGPKRLMNGNGYV